MTIDAPASAAPDSGAEGCPRKSSHPAEDSPGPAFEFVERRGRKVLEIRDFGLAKAFLKIPGGTSQAGFAADMIGGRGGKEIRQPLLYQEGPGHREQRRATAKFFTPKTVATRHAQMMEEKADTLVAGLVEERGGRLDTAAFRMALGVVAEVVGLTESDITRMEKRLDSFFDIPTDADRWGMVKFSVTSQWVLWRFYFYDVRPAIVARRERPDDDVISYLLGKGTKNLDILTEALTFGAAGMVTTRHFITMAVWHLLENEAMLARFRVAGQDERRAMLYEVLRLEPVAAHLLRHVNEDLVLEDGEHRLEIPAGTLVDVRVRDANIDQKVFGENAAVYDADRCPVGKTTRAGLSFGAGHHSCPGEYLAVEETDVFLQAFLRHDWELVRAPDVSWNDLLKAYDLSNLQVRLKT